MATKLHLGGNLSGQTVETPDTLSYVAGPDTYVLATMTDGVEIYAAGGMCYRDAKNLYQWWTARNPQPLAAAAVEQLSGNPEDVTPVASAPAVKKAKAAVTPKV